jgi:hypothetical protein
LAADITVIRRRLACSSAAATWPGLIALTAGEPRVALDDDD